MSHNREPRFGDVFLWTPYHFAVMYLGPGYDEIEDDVWCGVYLSSGAEPGGREVGSISDSFGSLTETEGGDYRWQFLGNAADGVMR